MTGRFTGSDVNNPGFQISAFSSVDINDTGDWIKLSKIGFNDTFLLFIDGLIEVRCESELSVWLAGRTSDW